jgi:hypothetical protein
MYLGTDDDGHSSPFQGMFCDLRFHSGALTATQIAAMYAPATRWDLYTSSGTQTPVAPANLIASFESIGSASFSRTLSANNDINQANVHDSSTRSFTPLAVALNANQASLGLDVNNWNSTSPINISQLPTLSFGSQFGTSGFSPKPDEDASTRFYAATTQPEDVEISGLKELASDGSKSGLEDFNSGEDDIV